MAFIVTVGVGAARRRRIAGDAVDEGNDGHVVAGIGVRPGISECDEQVIAADARHIVRMRELHMREAVAGGGDAIGGARRFNRIHRRAHRAIADGMNMQIEAGGVEAPREFQDHVTLVLQLAVGNRALRGEEPMFAS